MERPKIGILTSLSDLSPAYSLTGIILNQAKLFEEKGYDYDLLVLKGCNKKHLKQEGLPKNIKAILPQTSLHDYQWNEQPKKDFEEQFEAHLNGRESKGDVGYLAAVKPYDVIITHDLMFLGWHLPQNKAIRECVKEYPGKRWLHWVHSAPSGLPVEQACYPSSLRYQGCDNSTYVFLNSRQKQDVANHFQISTRDVGVCYNPKDLRDEFDFSEETKKLIDRYDLMNHQILQVYPFSNPRWGSKGVLRLLKIWGEWRKMGINAKLVLLNAHANQEKDERQVRQVEAEAKKCGLTPDMDVIISSRFASLMDIEDANSGVEWTPWKHCVPKRTVRELMMISNLFVFPSESECCSLIQAEAATLGLKMVLNRDFLPMLEFAPNNVLSYEFNANDPHRNPIYYQNLARELWGELQDDSTFQSKTFANTRVYNREWIWKNQLEPLLHRGVLAGMAVSK
jgi:hypothetical protein